MEGLSNLMENNLFLSLLSQGGASLAGEDSVAASINPILQGTIAAQSKTKEQNRQLKNLGITNDQIGMLAKILSAGVDFKSGADGKATISGNLADILGGRGGKGSELGTITQSTQPITDTGTNTGVQDNNLEFLKGLLNPNSSPSDVPAYSDLVGLTPQDISESLAGAINVRSLKQKIASDLAATKARQRTLDIQERQAKTAEGQLGVSELKAKNELIKIMTKDERTAAQKNYKFAKSEEGGGFEGTFTEFVNQAAETTHKRDYDEAVKGGYEGSFNTWMLEMAKAGAINLGDIVARKEATKDIETKKFFTDPKGLATAVDKFIDSEEVQNKLIAIEEDKREIETIREKEKFITNRIVSSGGKIVKSKLDGRTFVWTVEWPDGKTTEVRYAN